jgi:hypothetical protein
MRIARKVSLAVSMTMAAMLALSACSTSQETEIRGGGASVDTSASAPTVPPGAPSPEPSATVTEVAPGILLPSGAVTPSSSPSILRSKETKAAADFAQGMAAAMLYLEPVFAPRDRALKAVDLQFISGLTVTRLNDYYTWILDDAAWRKNADRVNGLIFIPPQGGEKRGYAMPAVQRQKFTNLVITEGPESTVDGAPTIKVAFTISGDLMWVDESDVAWTAPLSRNITYVVAEQDGSWALDGWAPSKVEIGQAQRATDEERLGVRFSSVNPYDWQGSDQPEPVPGL